MYVLQDKLALIGIGAGPVFGPEGQLWFIGVEFDVLFITVLQTNDNCFKIFEFQPLYGTWIQYVINNYENLIRDKVRNLK